MYQISAFYEVPRSQKIDFGEVVVIRDLVKMGLKYEKMTENVYFSQAIMPLAWFWVEWVYTHYSTQYWSISSTFRLYFDGFTLILAQFWVRKWSFMPRVRRDISKSTWNFLTKRKPLNL